VNGLYAALTGLLERLEANDASGAATMLSVVKAQLTAGGPSGDLLELRLLNARCQEAAKRLVHGLESKLQGAATSNRAITAYGNY
jgi:hypothetical protein